MNENFCKIYSKKWNANIIYTLIINSYETTKYCSFDMKRFDEIMALTFKCILEYHENGQQNSEGSSKYVETTQLVVFETLQWISQPIDDNSIVKI